jgi:hypothetical protein
MEKKRLTKYLWYGSDVDSEGNPIVPEVSADGDHLSGLNEGEVYIHNHPDKPALYIRTTDGNVVPIGADNVEDLEKVFLRKDRDDTAKGVITFEKGVRSKDFVQGNLMGAGWAVYKDANGNTIVETDNVIARKGIKGSELVVNQETFEKGSNIFVKGGCTITKVEEVEGNYRCFYDSEGGKKLSGFKVGDQARCQRYDSSYGLKVKYYWRLVTGATDKYVDLSMTDVDGDGVPEAGDDIAQLGSRTDKTRRSAIVVSPDDGGSVVVWAGIGEEENPYSLSEKNMCGMGVNPKNGRAYIYGYGDMFFGDRNLEKNFITYQIKEGETKPSLTINADVQLGKDSTGLGNLTEFKEVKTDIETINSQMEREFTVWYYDEEPTMENEPAVNWNTQELIDRHDQDIYFSDLLARAWRFVDGEWIEITDERTLAALNKVSDLEFIKQVFGENVVQGGVLISDLVGVQNDNEEIEAFLNGGDFAKDDTHGKLILAGGIPSDGENLEERSKNATTRVYEDGHLVSASAEVSGVLEAGTMKYKTLVDSGGDLTGYAMAVGLEGYEGSFVLPDISDGSFREVRVVWFNTARMATSYMVLAHGGQTINYKASNEYLSGKTFLSLEADIFYRFFSVNKQWYVSTEPILNQ